MYKESNLQGLIFVNKIRITVGIGCPQTDIAGNN